LSTSFTDPRWSIAIPYAWAFAEATALFIVPDVAVGLVALFRPERGAVATAAAIAGGVTGAAVLSGAIRRGWNPRPLLHAQPGLTAADFAWARGAVADRPGGAFLTAAVRGTPVKLLVAEATRRGVPPEQLLPLVVVNRAPRIAATATAMALLGRLARPVVRERPRAVAAVYVVAWSAFYVVFWSKRRD
jgi:hypothetical protein